MQFVSEDVALFYFSIFCVTLLCFPLLISCNTVWFWSSAAVMTLWAHSEQVGNREDVLLRYSGVNGAWEEMVCAEQRVFY